MRLWSPENSLSVLLELRRRLGSGIKQRYRGLCRNIDYSSGSSKLTVCDLSPLGIAGCQSFEISGSQQLIELTRLWMGCKYDCHKTLRNAA